MNFLTILLKLLGIFQVNTSCKNPCSSFERACECRAVDYCANYVWKYIATDRTSQASSNCLVFVNKLRRSLRDDPGFALAPNEETLKLLCGDTDEFDKCYKLKHQVFAHWDEVVRLVKTHDDAVLCTVLNLGSINFDACSRGPELYCGNFELARMCSGTKLCEDFDWSKRIRPVAMNTRCRSCLKAVNSLQNLKNPQFAYNDELCRSLYDAEDADACQITLANDGDVISRLLTRDNGVNVVCTLMGMCNNELHVSNDTNENAATTTTKPLIGGDFCTWGPSHWCSNFANAHECGSIAYCKELWKEQSVDFTEDMTESCYNCQLAVSVLSHEKNATSLIHSIFSDELESTNVSRSKTSLFRYLMELISLRHNPSDVNPSVLCYHLKLCSGDLKETKALDLPSSLSFAIWRRTVELLNSNVSVQDSINMMCKECDYLNFGSNCHQAVFYYAPVFIKLYKDGLRSSLAACKNVYACDQYSQDTGLVYPTSPLGCQICVLVVDIAKKMINDNATSSSVIDFLCTHLCSHFGSYEQQCIDYIRYYSVEIIALIESNLEATDVCRSFGLCSNLTLSPFTNDLSVGRFNACTSCLDLTARVRRRAVCRIKQFFNFFINSVCGFLGPLESDCMRVSARLKEKAINVITCLIQPARICYIFCRGDVMNRNFNSEVVVQAIANEICLESSSCQKLMLPLITNIFQDLDKECEYEIDKSKSTCDMCRSLNADVIQLLMNTTSNSAELKKKLTTACSDEECVQFIYDFGPALSTLLMKYDVPASGACDILNVCPSPNKEDSKPEKETDNCYVCKLFSNQLKLVLNNSMTVEELEDLLPKICDNFTDRSLKSYCDAFVFDFKPTIVKLIKQRHVKPRDLCGSLQVCQSNYLSDVGCSLCETVVGVVERYIVSNESESAIVEKALQACSKLPVKYHNKCIEFVHTYIARTIELVVTLSNPHLVCLELGLCFPVSSIPIPSLCSSCQIAIISARAWIEQNNIQEKVFEYLKFMCSMFSNDTYQDCEDSIRAIERIIMKFLDTEDPLKLCKAIHMCPVEFNIDNPGSDMVEHRLTAEDFEFCSQGIKVWCRSMENARRCNAVQQCLQNKDILALV